MSDKTLEGVVLFDGASFDAEDSTVSAEYDMPYAPDDYFEYAKKIRKLIRGNATTAAEAFGRTEAALDIGHAYGQNIVISWNDAPTLPLSPVYVQLAGIEGAFLADSVSYAWGPEGMVVSSDLLLIGVSGWYGTSAPATSWLRLPVPPTGLQQVSAGTVGTGVKANSVPLPLDFNYRSPGWLAGAMPTGGADSFALSRGGQSLIGPTLTLQRDTIATGPLLIAREFEYGLVLEPEVAAIATGPSITESTMVAAPAGAVELIGVVPVVLTGASVAVPVTAVSVAAVGPAVASGGSVAVPAAAVSVAGVVPDLVGRQRIQVAIPAGGVSVAALAPAVAAGASVAVPAAGVTVAGVAPVVTIPVVDPNFSSVSLLLHMDGSNGSTTFTDSSSNALTVTANGNAQISTAQSKFGGASGLFDGNGDYLLVPADGTAIGTGDFTIEGWIRTVAADGYRCIASLVPSSDDNSLYVYSNTIIWYEGGIRCQSATFTNNTWYHIAATRSSGTVRVFLDGAVSGTTFSSTANIGNNTTRIGTRGAANLEWFNGYIDDLRITKGVARYTANFTPPTAAFPDV
jgi:hypothetical protein